jgi:hypothetical protein
MSVNLIDRLIQFSRVLGSTVSPRTYAVKVDLSGVGSLDEEDEIEAGELGEQSEVWGALGFVSRPMSPEVVDGQELSAEVVSLRTGDGLVPITWRDLRLNSFFPNGVPEGRVGLVGYKGALHTIDVNASKTANIQTLYVPYDFDGAGEPQKAMVITLDTSNPGSEHITMSIGGGSEGYQITLNETDGLQIRTPNSSTFFNMREDEINLTATKILLKGNVYVGRQAETGVPLVAGPLSPPCPSLYVSAL